MLIARLYSAALLALVVVACGGSSDKKGILSGGGQGGTSSPWAVLLDAVPDTKDTRSYIVMNDYAAMRALVNLQPPKGDSREIEDYRRNLMLTDGVTNGAMPAPFSGLGQYFDPDEWLKQLGYSPGQVDADISAGRPPETYEALRGRFDAKAIETAIDKDVSPFRKDLTKTARGASNVYIWGEDFQQTLSKRSTVRPFGRGGRMAVKGDMLFWTYWTEGVNGMVDSSLGKKPSLADAADIKALLAGLKKQTVYTVIISDETPTPNLIDVIGDGSSPSAVRKAFDDAYREALKPYVMWALGIGQDAQGPFNLVVLLHTSDALAKENVTRLKAKLDTGKSARTQKPWKEQITRSKVTADGRLVIAKLHTNNRSLVTDVFNNQDNLLVHE